ncbi:MAG: hypothetical protein LBH22_00615 [Bacteroidales bacterium]|jgi:hypothetical protein|nr:hypothetical protein [Bacteroidales bacterium]
MKKLFVFIISVIALAYSINGQTCTCESNFEWVKKTFEENDAGFQYIIDKKGSAAHNIHNQQMLEKIREAKTLTECTKLLHEWLTFFRSGHIGIQQLIDEPISSQSVSQTLQKTETWSGDIVQFEKYIDTKKDADFEGIWEVGAYKIGIQKEGENYIGFIIESDVEGWKEPGLVKLKIEQDGDKLKSTYFMRDYSPDKSDNPELLGKSYLQIGRHTLKRLKPLFTDDPSVDKYFNAINSPNPFMEELNATTLYLRIPSFDQSEKRAIDDVIAANKEKILKTENLIIDLRNNGGGSDASYYELLPFLYTNPVRTVSVEFLSTTQNNQRFLDFATKQEYQEFFDETTREHFKELYEKLQNRLGEFVFLFNTPISIDRSDTVYEFPKNVGIIINEGNASTTEQFLLAAKQSKKVKLFGTTTFGALDVSNMYSVNSPCEEFQLWYCLSRSMRIPNMVIDDIGLQPDFYLDKTIPQYKWVEFVNGILNQ